MRPAACRRHAPPSAIYLHTAPFHAFCVAPTHHHILSHSSVPSTPCPPLVLAAPHPPCMCLARALVPRLRHAPRCALSMCATHLHASQAFSTHFGPSPRVPASTYAPRPFLTHCSSNRHTLVFTHTARASSTPQACAQPCVSRALHVPQPQPRPHARAVAPFDTSRPAPSRRAAATRHRALFRLPPHVFHPRRPSVPAPRSPADVYTRIKFSNNNNSISSYPISLCLYFSSWHTFPFLSLLLKIKRPKIKK